MPKFTLTIPRNVVIIVCLNLVEYTTALKDYLQDESEDIYMNYQKFKSFPKENHYL